MLVTEPLVELVFESQVVVLFGPVTWTVEGIHPWVGLVTELWVVVATGA